MTLWWGAWWLTLASVTPTRAGTGWVRSESANFQVYAHADRQDTTDIQRELEAFHALLAEQHPELVDGPKPAPLPVVAFDTPAEFAQFALPAPTAEDALPGGGLPTAKAPLIRLEGPRPMVVIEAGRWRDWSQEVFGAYTQSRLALAAHAPTWLEVGLSEFYATTQIQGEVATVGRPNADHIARLTSDKWIPLDELLAADRSSRAYKRKRELFAAESWLLVHWCLLDPENERQQLLTALLDPRGAATIDASYFNPVGLPTLAPETWLPDALRAYAAHERLATQDIPLIGVQPKDPADPAARSTTLVTPLAPVELEYRLGLVLTMVREYQQASTLFEHALGVDPASWMPHDGIGLVAAANLRGGEARRSFAEAVAREPTSVGPYLDHARTVLSTVHAKTARTAARISFERVVALDGTRLEAYRGLADLAYRRRDWLESGRWAGRGLQVDPYDSLLRAMLGRAQFASGDVSHARINTQLALQQCDVPRTCSEAASIVRVALARLPAASDGPTRPSPSPTPAPAPAATPTP